MDRLATVGVRRALLVAMVIPVVLAAVVLGVAVDLAGGSARAASERASIAESLVAINTYTREARLEAMIRRAALTAPPELDGVLSGFIETISGDVDRWASGIDAIEAVVPPEVRASLGEVGAAVNELRAATAAELPDAADGVDVTAQDAVDATRRWALTNGGTGIPGLVLLGDALVAFGSEGGASTRVVFGGGSDLTPERLSRLAAQTDVALDAAVASLDEQFAADLEGLLASSVWAGWQEQRALVARSLAAPDAGPVDPAAYSQAGAAADQALSGLIAGLSRALVTDAEVDADGARRLQLSLVVGGLAALLVGASLTLVVARSISRRLERMATVAERISAGELDSEPLSLRGSDELAKLGRAMDDMTATLRVTQAQIEALAEGALVPVNDELPGSVGRAMRTAIRRLDAATEDLRRQATHDSLTGLFDRNGLHTQVDASFRPGVGRGALLIDLDGFKQVNDEHGHEAGDAVLVAVAKRLTRNARGDDIVARLGGDEFVVVLGAGVDVDVVGRVADRILRAVAQPIDLGATVVSVGASIGWTVTDGVEPFDTALRRADEAMYAAKRAGRGTVVRSAG